MNLSKDFTLAQMTRSDTALRMGFVEQFSPSKEIIANLQLLCVNLLQPLNDAIRSHGVLRITSGYRCDRLNKQIGGSTTSDHSFGRAVDLELITGEAERNAQIVRALLGLGVPFKQMIWEFGNDQQPDWVHISYHVGGNRMEQLKAVKKGKTVYLPINLNF